MGSGKQRFIKIFIQVIALALLLFFFMPWVFVNCTGVYISGYDFAVGRRAVEGEPYPIVFGLVLVPVVIIILGFTKKSFAWLRNIAILGLVCLLAFMFMFLNTMENRGLGNYVEFTWFFYGMVAMYSVAIGFSLYSQFIIKRQLPMGYDTNGLPNFSLYDGSKKLWAVGYIAVACLFIVSWLLATFGNSPISTVNTTGQELFYLIRNGYISYVLEANMVWVIGFIVLVAITVILQVIFKAYYEDIIFKKRFQPHETVGRFKARYELWAKVGNVFALISTVSVAFVLGSFHILFGAGALIIVILLRLIIETHVVSSGIGILMLTLFYVIALIIGGVSLSGEWGMAAVLSVFGPEFLQYFMSAVTILIRGGGINLNSLMTILTVLAGLCGIIFVVVTGAFLPAYKEALEFGAYTARNARPMAQI
ncbi:MAG: hypothetical protein FWE11_06715 [Defluviitaleaceae bacterium]|nr:hypothetical protein [Defluviitaleaceae bacterium]